MKLRNIATPIYTLVLISSLTFAQPLITPLRNEDLLRVQKAEAEAKIAAFKEIKEDLIDVSKNSRQAAEDAKGAMMWALGLFVPLTFAMLGIGVFQYIKLSKEDRLKIVEDTKQAILPDVNKATDLAINTKLNARVNEVLVDINNLSDLQNKHTQVFYRALCLFYDFEVQKQHSNKSYGWATCYALNSLNCAHHSGNAELKRDLLLEYELLLTKGIPYFKDTYEEGRWDNEEIQVIDDLLSWITDDKIKNSLNNMRSFVIDRMSIEKTAVEPPLPLEVPDQPEQEQ